MFTKELLGLAGIAVDFGSIFPYIVAILKGTKKPHSFTWVIWGLTTSIIFASQLSESAGPGSWVMGCSAGLSFLIAALSYWKNPRLHITRLDWVFFLAALGSLPLWHFTSTPLWSVVFLCGIDSMGYVPTLRKAYVLPHEESFMLFVLQIIKGVLAIAALDVYSLTTVLFPAVITVMNALLLLCIALGTYNINRNNT
jgi:hypothetical protein